MLYQKTTRFIEILRNMTNRKVDFLTSNDVSLFIGIQEATDSTEKEYQSIQHALNQTKNIASTIHISHSVPLTWTSKEISNRFPSFSIPRKPLYGRSEWPDSQHLYNPLYGSDTQTTPLTSGYTARNSSVFFSHITALTKAFYSL